MSNPIKPDYLSFTSIFVEILWGNFQLGSASGFFWKTETGFTFFTNYHVVSGLHPETKQPLDINSSTPDQLRIWLRPKEQLGKCESFVIPLFDKQGRPKWIEHKKFSNNVDVVGLNFDIPDKYKIYPINVFEPLDFQFEISQDVFIIGFPRGISCSGKLPIWKRGSIASEPGIDVGNLPRIMIDCASREGMSGSPVIAQYVGYYGHAPDQMNDNDWFGTSRRFLGIYSGRLIGKDELEAQLGYVWKSSVIEEIILEGKRAK
jgi:hypothetical protein